MALYTILLRSRSRAVRGEGLSDVLCMGTGMVVVSKETTGEDVCEGDWYGGIALVRTASMSTSFKPAVVCHEWASTQESHVQESNFIRSFNKYFKSFYFGWSKPVSKLWDLVGTGKVYQNRYNQPSPYRSRRSSLSKPRMWIFISQKSSWGLEMVSVLVLLDRNKCWISTRIGV